MTNKGMPKQSKYERKTGMSSESLSTLGAYRVRGFTAPPARTELP